MNSLVSVLIPCHNAEKYVGAALDSVLAQTWRHLEIIVVNDNSTDGSAGVLEPYSRRGVRILTEKFGNASKARNCAYRHSTGAFVKFFDADDLLAPETIDLQMKRLAGSETAVASAEWGRFYNDDPATFKLNRQTVWRDMEALEWLVEAWMDAHPMTQPGIFLLPRPVVEKSGLWNEKLSLIDDFEFFARVFCRATEVRFAVGARLLYRSGIAGSLSGKQSPRAVESAFESVLGGTAHLLARRQDAAARRACANLLQSLVYTYYPANKKFIRETERRICELGGSELEMAASPRIKALGRLTGWKLASRVRAWVNALRPPIN